MRAVPKKKTSHMKQRSRRMAGKGMKDVTALNKCSACGHVKRAHLLCPYCVKGVYNMVPGRWSFTNTVTEIQDMFKGKTTQAAEKTTSDKKVDE